MTKIHDFQISIHTYSCRGRNNLFPEFWGCPHPACTYAGRLRKNGFYERHAISFEAVYRIVIQRYRCTVCGHTVSLLPSFLAPRFQYSLAVIFACLKVLILPRTTLAKAAASVAIHGFNYQHVRFYKARLEGNMGLCASILASLGYKGSPILQNASGDSHAGSLDEYATLTPKTAPAFLFTWVSEVRQRGGVELFALTYQAAWHQSFLHASPKNTRHKEPPRLKRPAA